MRCPGFGAAGLGFCGVYTVRFCGKLRLRAPGGILRCRLQFDDLTTAETVGMQVHVERGQGAGALNVAFSRKDQQCHVFNQREYAPFLFIATLTTLMWNPEPETSLVCLLPRLESHLGALGLVGQEFQWLFPLSLHPVKPHTPTYGPV